MCYIERLSSRCACVRVFSVCACVENVDIRYTRLLDLAIKKIVQNVPDATRRELSGAELTGGRPRLERIHVFGFVGPCRPRVPIEVEDSLRRC